MKALRIFLIGLFVVGALAYLNIIIPRPQQTQAKTWQEEHKWLAQEFTCASGTTNVIKLGDEETPDCSNGSLPDVSSYRGGVNISLENTSNWYRIHTTWGSYYCPELSDGSNGCNTAQKLTPGIITLKPGDYVHVWADTRNDVQKSCGAIQEDLSWTADVSSDNGKTWHNTACSFGSTTNPGADNSTATWCSTNVKCSSIVPTPTPTIPVTPTSTPTPTVTPSVTPTPTTPPPPQLVVIKEVHNNHGGTKVSSDFMIHVDGNNASPSDFAGPDYPLWVNINAGFYSVTEKQLPGYTLVSQNGCSGYIQNGQIINCTLVNEDIPASLTVIKVVNNNHGGTKQPSDFPLYVNGTHVTTGVANKENPGDYTVAEDKQDGYHLVSISGDCDSNGHVHLNAGDTKTCVIENEDNGGGACTMPTCNTNISGCSYPYPDTTSCSCGPLVCITQTPSQPNITINVSQQQQQQQQQAVLGASVAPAVSSNQLPRTGSGTEILFTLLGLLPIGLKLRKFV